MAEANSVQSQAAREGCSHPAQAAAQASLLSAVSVVGLQGWLPSKVLTGWLPHAKSMSMLSCMLRALIWPSAHVMPSCRAPVYLFQSQCLPSQSVNSYWPLCPCHAGNAGHLDDCLKAKVCAVPEREFSAVGASDAPPSLWRPAERIHRGPILQKGSGSVAGRALRHVGVPRMTLPFLGAQEHLGFFIQGDVHAQLKVT